MTLSTQWRFLDLGDLPLLSTQVVYSARGSDFHTFHLHGHRWVDPSGAVIDTKTIGPAETYTFETIAGGEGNGPGEWLYHCHVDEHLEQGMIGVFRVTS